MRAVEGGLSCIGAPATGAAAVCGAGGAGTGSGQIGSGALEPEDADWATLEGLLDCRRLWCVAEPAGCGFGLDAAAAATPGKTGPVGSGFMMLTAGIEEALGKSILTILCGPGALAVFACAVACAASADAPSGMAAHNVA